MSLLRRRNDGVFPGLRSSFPELFDLDNFLESPFSSRSWQQPAVNVKETSGHFEVEVAVPGLTREDFNVSVNNGVLSISCEKEEEKEEEKENYTIREFGYTSFNRSFNLPDNIDENDIKARYEEGVLKISLRKTPEATKEKARKINIS